MQTTIRPILLAAISAGLMLLPSATAFAQSGTRYAPPSSSTRSTPSPAGSGLRSTGAAPLALEGYCPVSLKQMNKWVKGSPTIQSVFDGHTYRFASAQGKQMFDADPIAYVPALGGDCVVNYAKTKQRAPGNIRYAARSGGRLFLLSSEQAKQMFLSNAATYADADLAYGGNCVVCRVNMGQTMPGRPELTVVHKGLRYRFPSEQQRREFLAHPEKYEATASASTVSSGGSGTRQPSGGGSSTRAGSGTR